MWLKRLFFAACLFFMLSDVSSAEASISEREPQVVSSSNFTRPQARLRLRNKYEPTWESLDARPLPKWYDEAKVGELITYCS